MPQQLFLKDEIRVPPQNFIQANYQIKKGNKKKHGEGYLKPQASKTMTGNGIENLHEKNRIHTTPQPKKYKRRVCEYSEVDYCGSSGRTQ